MKKHLKILLHTFAFGLLVIAILPVIILGTPASPAVGNWYQQFMPNIGGRSITDIIFLDSLNGYAVTNNLSVGDTGYVLKTINGGNNWNISFIVNRGFTAVEFINLNTGFACGGSGGGTTYLTKTTNAGLSWNIVTTPTAAKWQDMEVLNNDTLWLVDSDGLTGGVFRTTNGGTSWVRQLDLGSQNPTNIYFYNNDTGYTANNILYKTTNSGVNWLPITGGGFTDMYFINNSTGWKTSFQKTTNGGINWINQTLPQGGNILISQIVKFVNIGNDTIWGVGSTIVTGSGNRAMILKTTNKGENWLYQVPDSNINIFQYQHIDFKGHKNGWAYTGATGVHTTTGGDPIWVTGLQQISTVVPKNYELYQNYPNPFNPVTKIKFNITNTSSAAQTFLNVYNLLGKQVSTLINGQLTPGTYEIDFDASGMSSGVYFYRLTVTEGKEVYTDTKKMLLIK